MHNVDRLIIALGMILVAAPSSSVHAQLGQFDKTPVVAAEEALIVTPPGFSAPGEIRPAPGDNAARLQVTVLDAATGRPTFCRVNVVGPDGHFYHPDSDPYREYALRGAWPDAGQGNRPAKAPIRYFGHFFYTAGEFAVTVPAGRVRVEAWKGLEYIPVTQSIDVATGGKAEVELSLERGVDGAAEEYFGGDTHLHFNRGSDAEEKLIFDLCEAEDIRFGIVMCYNETDRYQGQMSALVSPQMRGLGRRSVAERSIYQVVSGQEYRNNIYGHLNLFWRDDLALDGHSLDPNQWPVFGLIGQQTQALGGYAFYAHGGYAQEIYADLALGAVNGVELLQFGIYRGIGLEGWYHVLNAGLTCPAVGASDYPACRKLADCRTYVHAEEEPSFETWLAGAAAGHSFVTSAPLVFFEVAGQRPGARLQRSGAGPHQIDGRLRLRSDTAPVTTVQWIVNGRVVVEEKLPPESQQGAWVELAHPLTIDRSSWVAVRAFSQSATGNANAEAHTNPIYVDIDGRAPYGAEDVAWLIARIDEQIAQHKGRQFEQAAAVVAYFEESRARLQAIVDRGGLDAPRQQR